MSHWRRVAQTQDINGAIPHPGDSHLRMKRSQELVLSSQLNSWKKRCTTHKQNVYASQTTAWNVTTNLPGRTWHSFSSTILMRFRKYLINFSTEMQAALTWRLIFLFSQTWNEGKVFSIMSRQKACFSKNDGLDVAILRSPECSCIWSELSLKMWRRSSEYTDLIFFCLGTTLHPQTIVSSKSWRTVKNFIFRHLIEEKFCNILFRTVSMRTRSCEKSVKVKGRSRIMRGRKRDFSTVQRHLYRSSGLAPDGGEDR